MHSVREESYQYYPIFTNVTRHTFSGGILVVNQELAVLALSILSFVSCITCGANNARHCIARCTMTFRHAINAPCTTKEMQISIRHCPNVFTMPTLLQSTSVEQPVAVNQLVLRCESLSWHGTPQPACASS